MYRGLAITFILVRMFRPETPLQMSFSGLCLVSPSPSWPPHCSSSCDAGGKTSGVTNHLLLPWRAHRLARVLPPIDLADVFRNTAETMYATMHQESLAARAAAKDVESA